LISSWFFFVCSPPVDFLCHRDELPAEIQAAAALLGYNKKYWDKDKTPVECDEDWEDLTPEQQEYVDLCVCVGVFW
jgi:hypothetical protein